MSEFNQFAPSGAAVFYRSYSRRKADGSRENFKEAITRTISAIAEIGHFTEKQKELTLEMALKQHCFPSGRALWVAGTEWSKKPENFPGYYNCCSMHANDSSIFGLLMELAMMGTGTGAVLEEDVVDNMPPIERKVNINTIKNNEGIKGGDAHTSIKCTGSIEGNPLITIKVGDSREGWASAYEGLIALAMGQSAQGEEDETFLVRDAEITLDLSHVRQAGEPLKGFGGTANPIRLQETFERAASLLSKAKGRKLTSIECCLLIDEAASAVVAGNIRRSAGMRQFTSNDEEAASSKEGLYKQDEDGNWSVDSEKEALRMANHTLCFHEKPDCQTIKASIEKQFWSGEGAIMYVPEAVARANADLLNTAELKQRFLKLYVRNRDDARQMLIELAEKAGEPTDERIIQHRMDRYGLNPCGEILMRDNLCNLSEIHLNTLDPSDLQIQHQAFYAGGLQVAALLQHKFVPERLAYSRENDPIVGVSFTGLFDFFVHAFGAPWLNWMMKGRPGGAVYKKFNEKEKRFLSSWRRSAEQGVKDYCEQHGIRVPNRFTTVQPAGSKSLLTGASSGWHPPKAQRFIRRITFGVNDPLVSALRDYGYSVIPAQSARDEQGNLLNDITDPRVQEVLVEIPTEVSWANLPGCDQFDLSKLPVSAQWGLYMQVQNEYTQHNTSATLEFRQDEIDQLSELVHKNIQSNGGYISAALLARFDANETFPRLPFEPIDKQTYDRRMATVNIVRSMCDGIDFIELLKQYDNSNYELKGAAGCDSAKCLTESGKDIDQIGLIS